METQDNRNTHQRFFSATLGAAKGATTGVVDAHVLLAEAPFHDCEDEDLVSLTALHDLPIILAFTPVSALTMVLHSARYSAKGAAAGWQYGQHAVSRRFHYDKIDSDFFKPTGKGKMKRADLAEEHCYDHGIGCLKNGKKGSIITSRVPLLRKENDIESDGNATSVDSFTPIN